MVGVLPVAFRRLARWPGPRLCALVPLLLAPGALLLALSARACLLAGGGGAGGAAVAGRQTVRSAAGALGGVLLELFERLDDQWNTASGLPARPRGPSSASSDCEDVSLRISKGAASRGYGAVRVTAVCRLPVDGMPAPCTPELPAHARTHSAPAFQHCDGFQSRWRDFQLSTSVVDVQPGEGQLFEFRHTSGRLRVDVHLPREGAGVHGVIIGDPCISSRYLPGLCNGRFDVLNRLPQILNLVNSVDRLDFIALLGDNFYDVHGALTAEFWRRLSAVTQQVFLLAVPGNHDFWMFSPEAPLPQDQLGIGFAQWYGQDTAGGGPAVSSWLSDEGVPRLPAAEQFFFHHVLGNVGFIGYSGAHSWEEQEHLFAEACGHFAQERPQEIYLLGHWNRDGLGCQPGMDVPRLFGRLREGACRDVAARMRYFMGHRHCNAPEVDGRGFMLGAGGSHGPCNEWGFAYTDTRGGPGSHLIAHFSMSRGDEDRFPAVEACVSRRGSLAACASSVGDVWVNGTLP